MSGMGPGMTALLWQTAVILLAAYFIGCWMGCLCRRVLFPARAEPAPAPVLEIPAEPAVISRFEAALKGGGNIPAPTPAAVAPPPIEPSPAPPAPRAEPAPPPRSQQNLGTAAALAAAAAAASMPRSQMPSQPGDPFPAAAGSTGQTSVAAPVVPPAPAPLPAQDLTLIRGIDARLAETLAGLGVTRFDQIAAWLPADVARVSKDLGLRGVISRDNWIEQAQILAKGGKTHFSSSKTASALTLAEPTADEGEPLQIVAAQPAPVAPPDPAPVEPAPVPVAAEIAAKVAAAAAAVADVAKDARGTAALSPVALNAAIGLARDNLKRIGGINAEVERLLNVQGVTKYSQIANWQPADVTRFDRLLGFDGRIARENWIEQAQILARGGETAYSKEVDRPRPTKLAEAIKAQGEPGRVSRDVAGLRSVRSEAYRDEAAASRPAVPDDLKRIRGIGVLIEKRLMAMGVTNYRQIANWTTQDIQRYSDKLDFKGRIEREKWVEQARILASGGTTEFSRRVDRGEVDGKSD